MGIVCLQLAVCKIMSLVVLCAVGAVLRVSKRKSCFPVVHFRPVVSIAAVRIRLRKLLATAEPYKRSRYCIADQLALVALPNCIEVQKGARDRIDQFSQRCVVDVMVLLKLVACGFVSALQNCGAVGIDVRTFEEIWHVNVSRKQGQHPIRSNSKKRAIRPMPNRKPPSLSKRHGSPRIQMVSSLISSCAENALPLL